MDTGTQGMESSLHLSAYPLADCSRTTRTRFSTDTVQVGIDGTFLRCVPFASGRSPAVLIVPERRTSPFGAAFTGQPRRSRNGGLRTLIRHSDPHAFKAGTCMTRLSCSSLLRSTSLRSPSVLRGCVQDHKEVLRLSRSLDCRYPCFDRVLPAVHYRYDTRTIAPGANLPSSKTLVIAPPGLSLRTTNTHSAWHACSTRSTSRMEPQAPLSALEGSAIGRQLCGHRPGVLTARVGF